MSSAVVGWGFAGTSLIIATDARRVAVLPWTTSVVSVVATLPYLPIDPSIKGFYTVIKLATRDTVSFCWVYTTLPRTK